jgi:DNA-directed RNA polymerase specialized sigma24 family protein
MAASHSQRAPQVTQTTNAAGEDVIHLVDDHDDFEALYNRRWTPMVRLARAIIGPHGPAEDLTQDAFARTLLRWEHVCDPERYLRVAVVNACRSELRRRRTRRRKPSSRTTADGPDVYLADALDQLPTRQRIAIVLRYYDQATEAEIGATLGCSPAAAGALLHRGLEALRKTIAPD